MGADVAAEAEEEEEEDETFSDDGCGPRAAKATSTTIIDEKSDACDESDPLCASALLKCTL